MKLTVFFTVLIWTVYKCGCALLLIIKITRVWKRNWKSLLVRSGKSAQINCRIWNKLWKRFEVSQLRLYKALR